MTSSTVFTILMIIAGSSVLTAAVTGYLNRHLVDATRTKTKADAAKTLSDLAIEQTTAMAEQMGEFRTALRAHREWDRSMVRKARELGLDFDDPPELFL